MEDLSRKKVKFFLKIFLTKIKLCGKIGASRRVSAYHKIRDLSRKKFKIFFKKPLTFLSFCGKIGASRRVFFYHKIRPKSSFLF